MLFDENTAPFNLYVPPITSISPLTSTLLFNIILLSPLPSPISILFIPSVPEL